MRETRSDFAASRHAFCRRGGMRVSLKSRLLASTGIDRVEGNVRSGLRVEIGKPGVIGDALFATETRLLKDARRLLMFGMTQRREPRKAERAGEFDHGAKRFGS